MDDEFGSTTDTFAEEIRLADRRNEDAGFGADWAVTASPALRELLLAGAALVFSDLPLPAGLVAEREGLAWAVEDVAESC